jgi:hypothetical protein
MLRTLERILSTQPLGHVCRAVLQVVTCWFFWLKRRSHDWFLSSMRGWGYSPVDEASSRLVFPSICQDHDRNFPSWVPNWVWRWIIPTEMEGCCIPSGGISGVVLFPSSLVWSTVIPSVVVSAYPQQGCGCLSTVWSSILLSSPELCSSSASWCVIPNRVASPSGSSEQRLVLIIFPSKFPEWSGFKESYLQRNLFYLWIGWVFRSGMVSASPSRVYPTCGLVGSSPVKSPYGSPSGVVVMIPQRSRLVYSPAE